jgi:5-methylcytosine-specific restriction endonuclease McrA
VKGKPKGCAICHRERERQRPYNPDVHRLWAQRNKEHIREYRKRWNATSGRIQADYRRGGPESFEYARLISNDPCAYCGKPTTEIDHIRPVARGGSGEWMNLTPSCRSCNASKNDTPLLHFLHRRMETPVVVSRPVLAERGA